MKTSAKISSFPTKEDLQGAATALLRLQDTYALPTEKLARGEIQGIRNSPELTGEETDVNVTCVPFSSSTDKVNNQQIEHH